jgi:hypothetical protein
MQANNNGPSPWRHPSTIHGILQLKLKHEREEAERIEAQKTDADRFHEEALQRFYARCSKGEGAAQRSSAIDLIVSGNRTTPSRYLRAGKRTIL